MSVPLRVSVRTTGGIGAFPGLEAARTVDAGTLAPADRTALERLVQEAGFFTLPSRLPAPAGSADHQSHEIEVEDGRRRHRVTVDDPIADSALQALVDAVRRLSTRP